MRVIKEVSVSIVIITIFILLGVVSSLKIWNEIDKIKNPPIVTSWEMLNNPVKFIEIVNVSYADENIEAKGVDGKLYYLKCVDQACYQWGEVQTVPYDYDKKQGLPIKKLKGCPKINPPDENFPTKEPPGIIAECVLQYTRSGPGMTGTYIVLLEDGKVWRWHPQNTASDMPTFLVPLIIVPALGSLAGLIVGGLFVGLYLFFSRRKSNSH